MRAKKAERHPIKTCQEGLLDYRVFQGFSKVALVGFFGKGFFAHRLSEVATPQSFGPWPWCSLL